MVIVKMFYQSREIIKLKPITWFDNTILVRKKKANNTKGLVFF